MKKLSVNFGIITIILFGLFSCKQEKKEVKLTSQRDSLSYALGVYTATGLKQDKIDTLINLDLYNSGINDVFLNANPLLTSEQATNVIQEYFTQLQKKEMEKMRIESENYLKENAKKEGVVQLPSGLQYKVIKMGNGPKPKKDDKVKVSYVGKLVDGTVFDSTQAGPVEFEINDKIIAGWQEGLQLMPVGSKFEFVIPYQLGYGENGYPRVIPPYSTLIFEIELLDIVKK